MALVNMKEMLEDARCRKYAVAAFDVSNSEMVKCVLEAAEELRSPVILAALKADIVGKDLDLFMGMINGLIQKSSVPVAVHLDHSVEQNEIERCIQHGFSSVMYDGSSLSFDENVKNTKIACDYAHQFGITVEAELGHVTNAISGDNVGAVNEESVVENPKDFLTDPEDVKRFVELTNVDALAVAIGTAHGVYTKKPELDFERLEEINKISKVPLVMHGGSGTPDEAIQRSIELGICKINIYSELLYAWNSTMKETLNSLQNLSAWPSLVNVRAREAMKEVARNKMILFGSAGKAEV